MAEHAWNSCPRVQNVLDSDPVTLKSVRAMVLDTPGSAEARLVQRELPVPVPESDQVLLEVRATAVCRTDLHIMKGELRGAKPHLVPGHQIVGSVVAVGDAVSGVRKGDRLGVPWLGSTCGRCTYCKGGSENLCDDPAFTGFQLDGGYAEYVTARAAFTLPIPEAYRDEEAAPLLCAGLIGYRALRIAEVAGLEDPGRLGLFGFGSSAQLVIQVARHLGHDIYVYTRGDSGRRLATELGAIWAGGGEQVPPVPLDSVIIFAPAGELVPLALAMVRKGGSVVCAGIHMSAIPQFDYELLWGERVVRSVANLTRADGNEFLELAPSVPVRTTVQVFPLEQANEALRLHEAGELRGTAVLVP
jgi:alcohol dehydrogenase, propanol-preferring